MDIQKTVVVDLIEVLEDSSIQIREKTKYTDNGVEIGAQFHRRVITPGDDFSNETSKVQEICRVLHTPDVVQTYLYARNIGIAAFGK